LSFIETDGVPLRAKTSELVYFLKGSPLNFHLIHLRFLPLLIFHQ
jgi:hypothetical protein